MIKERGLTLIELMVAISIFSIVILVITAVYVKNLSIFKRESTYSELQTSGKAALDRILYDLRQAQEVKESVTDGGTTYTSSSSEVILKVPALTATGEIRYDEGQILYYDYLIYTFNYSEGKIIKNTKIDPNSQRPNEDGKVVAQNVAGESYSYFSYLPDNPPADFSQVKGVAVSFRLQKDVRGETLRVDFQSEAKLRNK